MSGRGSARSEAIPEADEAQYGIRTRAAARGRRPRPTRCLCAEP